MNYGQMTAATVFVLILSVQTLADPGDWDRAWWFREQVGLSPTDLAAIGLEADVQEELSETTRGPADTWCTEWRFECECIPREFLRLVSSLDLPYALNRLGLTLPQRLRRIDELARM